MCRFASVTTVDIESNKGLERVAVGRTRAREYERLVLGNASGATIRPSTWDQSTERVRINGQNDGGEQWVGTSTDGMRTAVARFLSEPAEPRMSLWQGQSVPLVMSGALLSIAAVMTVLGVLSLFTRPTELVYAAAERLAAIADQKRRR